MLLPGQWTQWIAICASLPRKIFASVSILVCGPAVHHLRQERTTFFTRNLFRPCSLVFTFTSISILKSSFQGQFFFYSLGCSMDHVTRRERAMMNMLKHVPVIGDLAKKLIIERRNQAAGPAPTVVCITHSAHPHRPVGTSLLTGLDIPTDRQTQAH